jgi:hypothetical protein
MKELLAIAGRERIYSVTFEFQMEYQPSIYLSQ